jgi:hypothetical protein
MKKFVKLGIVLSLLSSSFSPVFAQAADQANHTYETANLNEGLLDESTVSNDEGKEIVEENTEEVTVPDDSATNETNTPADSSTVESTIETVSKDEAIESTTQSSEVESQESPSALEEEKETEAQGTPVEIDSYVTITSEQFDIWKDFDWIPIDNKEQFFQKTFHVKEYYINENGKKYFSLYSNKDLLIGYIEESQVTVGEGLQGINIRENKYVSLLNENYQLWQSFDFKTESSEKNLLNRTFKVKESFNHYNEHTYYSLYDNKDKWYGYIDEKQVSEVNGQQGAAIAKPKYVTVTSGGYSVWSNFSWKEKASSKSIQNKTFKAKVEYHHFNGSIYYSLYDKNNKWMGYINASATKVASGQQGTAIAKPKYVTVTSGGYSVWSNFSWKEKASSKSIQNKTFKAKVEYHHFNGSIYYSLYDKNNKWMGYINASATKVASGQQGTAIAKPKYVTVTSGGYSVWSNFSWKKKVSSKSIQNKTFKAKVEYHHFNGSIYYSLYDKNNKWMGYINASAAKVASGQQGTAIAKPKYVTVTSGGYSVWSNFSWKEKASSKSIQNKTFKAKVEYHHFNGSIYYSLYDKNNKWMGYINASAAKVGSGAQGAVINKSTYVTVTKGNYSVWKDFKWNKKQSTKSMVNKNYQAKRFYNHFNGSKYYSLYDTNGKWIGYINASATKEKKTAASYMGTSRAKIVNELSRHQNDNFYLGTPYKGLGAGGYSNAERFMVPRGAPNGYGVGMNCTGFVAYVVKKTGAKMGSITNVANAYGGLANAYNWRDALLKNTMSYSFNSVDELLKSGKAKKGDIIYFEADFTKPNYDCHIAFFWGNTPSENKTWHQVGRGNMISNIFSGTPYSKVYLIPLD